MTKSHRALSQLVSKPDVLQREKDLENITEHQSEYSVSHYDKFNNNPRAYPSHKNTWMQQSESGKSSSQPSQSPSFIINKEENRKIEKAIVYEQEDEDEVVEFKDTDEARLTRVDSENLTLRVTGSEKQDQGNSSYKR